MNDREAYPRLPRSEPSYLCFMVDCDGSANELLARMAQTSHGLRRIFGHCEGFEVSMLESALALDPQARDLMVATKVTCPFLGSLVHQELLSVRGATDNPLANIEDVRRLGNEGGGDLGDLLAFFAAGNHALMRNSSGGALDTPVPAGLFSLELPGSQGSHPGHSGILQGNPTTLGSGRLSQEDFDRLAKLATDNCLKRSDVGKFIAQNLKMDPNSKVASANVAELMARDLAGVVGAISTALASKLPGSGSDDNHRLLEQKLPS